MNSDTQPQQISLFDPLGYRGGTERERERERERAICHAYNSIISFENLLTAWQEFLVGKRKRGDVARFGLCLTDNILQLHHDLVNKTYRHGKYCAFKVNDPKPRDIHKASVRDRLVHHAVYRILYAYFDRKFIHDSYSCRKNKGTHRAIRRFAAFAHKVSSNQTQTVWVLKCDIRKFFANIDHQILKDILTKHFDRDTSWLLGSIIDSFNSTDSGNVGLPLGNLTSQLLVNVYMNDFDQYMRRILKAKYYIRYADDFVILSTDRSELAALHLLIIDFLNNRLKLTLNPHKVQLKTLASGVDFLGWVHFPDHRVIRPITRRRALQRMRRSQKNETYQSYTGLLKHGNAHKVKSSLDIIYLHQRIQPLQKQFNIRCIRSTNFSKRQNR